MNIKSITIKKDNRKIFFIVQIVAVVILLAIGAVSLFIKDLKPYFYLLLSINMLVLVINNFLILKRPYIWLLYIALAIYTFIIFIQGIV